MALQNRMTTLVAFLQAQNCSNLPGSLRHPATMLDFLTPEYYQRNRAHAGGDADHYENALYEAGCDDALIAVIDDTIFVDFDREATSFEEAVRSATLNIEKAGGKVIEVKRIIE